MTEHYDGASGEFSDMPITETWSDEQETIRRLELMWEETQPVVKEFQRTEFKKFQDLGFIDKGTTIEEVFRRLK